MSVAGDAGSRPRRRVAFVHPDLGLGGAERLVLDAAVAAKEAGHEVRLFVSSLDPSRCFPEAVDGSLDVRVHGSRIPREIGGRLRAPCAVLRTAVAAVAARRWDPDLFFCDAVAHVLPLLRGARGPVLFYGHFPDLLLAPRGGMGRGLYRGPIDALERAGTALADRLLVNSRFTADTFARELRGLRREPEVLHPGVDLPEAAAAIEDDGGDIVLLSINRFDPAKGLGLAVRAFVALGRRVEPATFARTRLVLAGGLDRRLPEQVREFEALGALARELGVGERVELLPSIDDATRARLLACSRALLYTPGGEHFGIVPLEAMAAARPVVAVDSGGPRETVVDGVTGFLRPADPEAFADALAELVRDPHAARRLGLAGRERVASGFSRRAFAQRLLAIVDEMTGGPRP